MEHAPGLDLVVGRPAGSELARAYVAEEAAAMAFFPSGWTDPDAYEARAAEVDGRFDRDARALAREAIHAPTPEAAARLERWLEEDGYLVTTGQQPGLFGGPLYGVYKALTAVRLAASLEERLGRPVLPVFWVASEDHDWEEADHAHVVGMDNELHRVVLDHPADEERPLSRVPLDDAVTRALETFLGHLPGTDFSPPFRELLQGAWTPGATLPVAHRETLAGLLGEAGLFFVDAADPALKRASRENLRRELEGAADHERLLAERADALREAGYHVQVPVLEGGVNLFVEGPAGRERLYRDRASSFQLHRSGESVGRDALLARIEESPGEVSPNVILRPVVEAGTLPTVAYVAGPGEIAYYAQLQPFYEAHGVGMPVIHPRHAVTAVESKVGKVLDKFGLEIDALDRPAHEVASALARDEVPDDVRAALGEIRGAIGKGSAALADAVKALDPTLKGPVSHARGAALDAFRTAEKKILQAVKRENEIALQQVEKARLHLFPGGTPQERVQNVFYYLFRYGTGFLDAVRERCDPPW